ncbi:hypothetical protein [uncultured Sphingomonas sp.]|uniref:hypothetical protein n=1 Tax=uncultured Sphingomonas sp. TaxID=158754 RepID=UPI0025CCE4FC|nr:hypothetical protein [uncultured Sphingomonas sp.]
MSSNNGIPSDMWGALLRIEGNTARTEAKIDAIGKELGDLKSRVDHMEDAQAELRSDLDKITAERGQQVPDFEALKLKVADLEKSRLKIEHTAKIVQFIFGGQLVALTAGVVTFAKALHAI